MAGNFKDFSLQIYSAHNSALTAAGSMTEALVDHDHNLPELSTIAIETAIARLEKSARLLREGLKDYKQSCASPAEGGTATEGNRP